MQSRLTSYNDMCVVFLINKKPALEPDTIQLYTQLTLVFITRTLHFNLHT